MKKYLLLLFLLFPICSWASTCGYINNQWYCFPTLTNGDIDWTTLNKNIKSAGVNWNDVNGSGVINSNGVNWNDVNAHALMNSGATNWSSLNQNIASQSVNWQDFRVFGSKYGNNSGINWTAFGV